MADDILPALGWSDRWAALAATAAEDLRAPSTPGRVIRHDGALVTVATADELVAVPVLASIDPAPVVGDWVLVADGAVRATLERLSLLRRRDTTRDTEQAIVANVDIVFIVCGLDRPIRPGRVQRATALAVDAGAQPIIVLTKADAVDDPQAVVTLLEETNPGVDVLLTSSRSGAGIDEVRRRTAGHTVVLIGESGAGKSRLTNALREEEVALVGEVREGDSKGRHTTSHREIHTLAGGGILVDTPGIRSVGLWTDTESVDATFDDVEALAADCRFSDCAHQGEPGCAVRAAIERGELDPARLAGWRGLVEEADQAARRQEAKAWRQGEGRAPRNQTRRGRARVPDDPEDE
ncbi:ribosome small subunit-dependent GTPase A [Iamia sp. SCSIO 61187]|uniref:ribosome small subunit-dependent GTPase A n=1 Tax=Iamia sp. SCSIO 61187 TaxID=2722752 RepID=UPI001C6294D9|nr:ribosome small subunit-dependent GTPase A [Iamia sp. SCSIO 61187]QYG91233.1 ribosome small subunit-dependent GTPase A [Iamia sp. SCSIO 61187]